MFEIVDEKEETLFIQFAGGPLSGKKLKVRRSDIPPTFDVLTTSVHTIIQGENTFDIPSEHVTTYKFDEDRFVFAPEGSVSTPPAPRAEAPTPPPAAPAPSPNNPPDDVFDAPSAQPAAPVVVDTPPDGVQIYKPSQEQGIFKKDINQIVREVVASGLDGTLSFGDAMNKSRPR